MATSFIRPKGNWYYDVISPYAYLFAKSRGKLANHIDMTPVPIFFPGLLRKQNNVGPAEVPEKRLHTYAFCVWKAKELGIPFQFPNRHPFSSIAAMRLLYAENSDWNMVDRAMDFIWRDGGDPETQWGAFCQALGLSESTPKPQSEEIKQGLMRNTDAAAKAGVFGVPSVVVNERVFWGLDTIDWIAQYTQNPDLFNDPAYQRALSTANPLLQKKS